jgi:hypothetical protein
MRKGISRRGSKNRRKQEGEGNCRREGKGSAMGKEEGAQGGEEGGQESDGKCDRGG